MSRAYQRYRQRDATKETAAEQDRRHREALGAVSDAANDVPMQAVRRGNTLLQVEDVHVAFGEVRAVDGVSFTVGHGECVGLVGESGCGKTTLARAIIGLVTPDSGRIQYEEQDVAGLKGEALAPFRRQVQMVFQDPFGSLNPRMTVGRAIREVLLVHKLGDRKERRQRAEALFQDVGLDPAYLNRFPHEFSGGQRQRIGIARALAVQPRLLIMDEPVSALDVSVQVQILNLLKDLQRDKHLTYVFVAHDLAVVRYLCTRILVMYLGRVVETSTAGPVYTHPLHPYTKALLSAVPDVQKGLAARQAGTVRAVLSGEVPEAAGEVKGCAFHPRCPFARDRCRMETPALREVRVGHSAACHFAEELDEAT
jgi:oligopeptide/dipeptide ABC transporter ATP-binding protein